MTAPLVMHLAMPIVERQQCTAILASPTPPQSAAGTIMTWCSLI